MLRTVFFRGPTAGLLFLLLVLSGCSDLPGASTIRAQVEDDLHREGRAALFAVKNFQKKEGFLKGPATYVAQIEYDLEFKKGLAELHRELDQGSGHPTFNSLGYGFSVVALKLQYGDFRPGERIHQAEQVTLLKTKNGWLLQE